MTWTVTRRQLTYAVQPVVWFGSDTSLLDRYGSAYTSAQFVAAVDANMLLARQWYYDQLGGYTFDANPAVFYRSSRTEAQLATDYPYNETSPFGSGAASGRWFDGMAVGGLLTVDSAGLINVASPRRLHQFISPLNNLFRAAWEDATPFVSRGANHPCGPGFNYLGRGHGRTAGGLKADFIAHSTISNSPGTAGTSFTVTAGKGATFAIATNGPTGVVGTAPSPATSGLSMTVVCDGNSTTRFPGGAFNAVVWPAETNASGAAGPLLQPIPTPANAEAFRVSGFTTSYNAGTDKTTYAFTLSVRGQDGTTARTVVAGDRVSARYEYFATIWAAASQPEAPTVIERAWVTSRSGDTLAVTRNADGGGVRNVVAGDHIAIESSENYLDDGRTSTTTRPGAGTMAHEIGHGLGSALFLPNDPLFASSPPYGCQGLPHAPDFSAPYRLMLPSWYFPDVIFDSTEKTRVLRSPLVTLHSTRP